MAKVKLWNGIRWVVTDAANANTLGGQPASYYATSAALTAHINNKNNPHSVTAPQIGAETPTGAQQRVDNHANLTNAHGATSASTANRIVMRDGSGRARVKAPSTGEDIANKTYADARETAAKNHANNLDSSNRTWTTTEINNAKSSLQTNINNVQNSLTTAINGVRTQTSELRLETRTSDPSSPATGRIWLRTDL